jgi:hypothetical protein
MVGSVHHGDVPVKATLLAHSGVLSQNLLFHHATLDRERR